MLVQNRNIVIQNSSFEKVEKLKYLGVTVTYTNDIREEIKLRTNMGNSYYYSLGKMLSFHLLSKDLIVKSMYISRFRARQHLRSLAPVMNDGG